MPRSAALDLMNRSLAGLLLFQPTGNHLESQPNKLFEYMAAGLPVIASDFPLWREIVEGHDCGICVRPDDIRAIAAAIDRLAGDPGLVERMGANGRRLIETRYSWAAERRSCSPSTGTCWPVPRIGVRPAYAIGSARRWPKDPS